ncbi:MAG: DUF177 domain-containing protein [Pseudomonadota bacterium]
MGNPLRDRRTVAEWASAGQAIEITEKIGAFDGLAAILEADLAALEPGKIPENWRESRVTGALLFGYLDTDNRVPAVTGQVEAEVDAVCQRCLEPFRLRLAAEPKLLLLGNDESDAGYDEYEVWELDERLLKPQDIVEELLVMALPFSAVHDNMAECRAFGSDGETTPEKTTRPFAALRQQMAKDTDGPDN